MRGYREFKPTPVGPRYEVTDEIERLTEAHDIHGEIPKPFKAVLTMRHCGYDWNK